MSTIDEEIKRAKEAAEKRIAALEARKAKEEAQVRERMLTILEEKRPDTFKELRGAAVDQLEAEKAKRRAAGKAARAKKTSDAQSGDGGSAPAAPPPQQTVSHPG